MMEMPSVVAPPGEELESDLADLAQLVLELVPVSDHPLLTLAHTRSLSTSGASHEPSCSRASGPAHQATLLDDLARGIPWGGCCASNEVDTLMTPLAHGRFQEQLAHISQLRQLLAALTSAPSPGSAAFLWVALITRVRTLRASPPTASHELTTLALAQIEKVRAFFQAQPLADILTALNIDPAELLSPETALPAPASLVLFSAREIHNWRDIQLLWLLSPWVLDLGTHLLLELPPTYRIPHAAESPTIALTPELDRTDPQVLATLRLSVELWHERDGQVHTSSEASALWAQLLAIAHSAVLERS